MVFNFNDFQNLLVIINFFVIFIIFLYAFYLYSIEKRIRSKYKDLQGRVGEIIEAANKKSIDILTKSDYMSNSLKKEVTDNFEKILEELRIQSGDFYGDITKTYERATKDFVNEIKKEGAQDISQFGQKLKDDATSLGQQFDKKLAADYEVAKQEIENYKKLKIEEFDKDLKQKIVEISKKVIPEYIPQESQERLVRDILEKLSKEQSIKAK